MFHSFGIRGVSTLHYSLNSFFKESVFNRSGITGKKKACAASACQVATAEVLESVCKKMSCLEWHIWYPWKCDLCMDDCALARALAQLGLEGVRSTRYPLWQLEPMAGSHDVIEEPVPGGEQPLAAASGIAEGGDDGAAVAHAAAGRAEEGVGPAEHGDGAGPVAGAAAGAAEGGDAGGAAARGRVPLPIFDVGALKQQKADLKRQLKACSKTLKAQAGCNGFPPSKVGSKDIPFVPCLAG